MPLMACNKPVSTTTTVKDSVKSYQTEIQRLKSYAKQHQYNQKLAFFIDFSLHSGKNRFFVVDLIADKIILQGLVCHGDAKGKNSSDYPTVFSNTIHSHSSSLGMAVVEERAYSSWGKHVKYWLKGLESTNSKMRQRIVVLHAWTQVPDSEVYPASIAMSWGCPTVSVKFLDQLDALLAKEKKVLLYTFQ